jgi:hypothetical protein
LYPYDPLFPTLIGTTKDLLIGRIPVIIYYRPKDCRQESPMTQFRQKTGTKRASRSLKKPIPDAESFNAIVQSLRMQNPLGGLPYVKGRKNHPPVEIVRERYTAKFVYYNEEKTQVGYSSEVYDSPEGYETGIAAVISNMANIASHRGRVRHVPAADRFSAILKCHAGNGEHFFVSLSRRQVSVASYTDDAIKKRVEAWADTVPALS